MTPEEIYKESIERWKNHRGIGTISYSKDLNLFVPIKIILNKYYNKNPNDKVIVVVPTSKDRDEFANSLVDGFEHYDKLGKDLLKFYTSDYIIANNVVGKVDLIIFYKIDRYSEGKKSDILAGKYISFKYCFGATNVPNPDNAGFNVYKHCQLLHRISKIDVITHGVIDGIVEYNIPVDFYEDDRERYDELSTFISDTLEMFDGDFELIMKCYKGDFKSGIAGDHFRNQLAISKGWNKDLDLTLKIYQDIDRYYNPNSIYERSKAFYDAIRTRNNLLVDNPAKLDSILSIVEKYKDKKILIVSKRSEFASRIANVINERIDGNDVIRKDKPVNLNLFSVNEKKEPLDSYTIQSNLAVEYHPDVESRPLIDPDTNDYVRIKSGSNKGSVKKFGATSLNKIANERFNNGYHNVISANNAMPKEGAFTIDFIVITSPECDTLKNYQHRLASLDFKENVRIVNLYTLKSKESKQLENKQSLTKNKIVTLNNVSELNL